MGAFSFFDSFGNQTGKNIAKEMLNAIFANTTMQNLLELSNRDKCAKFAFDYKESLLKHLITLRLYPIKGTAGDISIISVDEIIPGNKKNIRPENAQKEAQLIQKRDEFCIDAGYIYVGIFQIYGALAINRFDDSFARTTPMRGGVIRPGKLGGLDSRHYSDVLKSMVGIFIDMYESNGIDGANGLDIQLELSTNTYLTFSEKDVLNSDGASVTVTAEYTTARSREGKDITLSLEKSLINDDKDTKVVMNINGIHIASFVQDVKRRRKWVYYLEEGSTRFITIDPKMKNGELVSKIKSACEGTTEATVTRSISGSVIASGSSVFVGYDKLRKTLSNTRAGKTSFPVAYAVARALTTIYPIEQVDRVSPQTITQVCNKNYNFERNGAFMPVENQPLKENVYFSSFAGLYYDTYQLKGKSIEFSKSKGGAEDLEMASKDLAALYNVGTVDSIERKNFIERGAFKKFDIACKTAQGNLTLTPSIAAVLNKEVVVPLRALQSSYSASADSLISKLFDIQTTTLPNGQTTVNIDFAKALTQVGGRQALDEIRIKARQLLLHYYMTADAYFIKGITIIEGNMNQVL